MPPLPRKFPELVTPETEVWRSMSLLTVNGTNGSFHAGDRIGAHRADRSEALRNQRPGIGDRIMMESVCVDRRVEGER